MARKKRGRGRGKAKGRKVSRKGRAGKPIPGRRGPRGEGALQNILRKVLKRSKGPRRLAEIAKAVLDAGYETTSDRFSVIVGQRLAEMSDVRKAGRGLYMLR